jgi:uncharacterized protein
LIGLAIAKLTGMHRTFLLPGWLNSGPAHWQSRWEAIYGYARVPQHDWQRPLRGDWIAQLETVLLSNKELSAQLICGPEADLASKSVVLVAHSLGCHLVAAWAAHSRHAHGVRGALLVAPPDPTQADWPSDLHNWRQPLLQRLPFPSVCVTSSNDPFDKAGRGTAMGQAWGARCVDAGPLGHINGDSGLNDWPAGHALLAQLQN